MSIESNRQQSGTLIAIVQLPGPHAPQPAWKVGERRKDDEVQLITYDPDGRLTLTLQTANGVFQIRSCPLVVSAPCSSTILARWSLPELMELQIDGHVVAAINNATVCESYTVAAKTRPAVDFSTESAAEIVRRRKKVASFRARPNRKRADPQHLAAALKNEANQLADLRTHLANGRLHHAVGLAALLRRLIVAGTPLPLLQYCAALSDEPLIVFTGPSPRFMPSISMDGAIILNISALPDGRNCNPADLDLWLDTPGGRTSNRVFTHRELLAAIGNTVGAHIDPDLHPYVTMLLEIRVTPAAGPELNGLIHYILDVAAAVHPLTRSL